METTQDTRRVFEGRLISVRVDTVLLPDGRSTVREVVEHPGAVAIVPVDAKNHVLLVKQYRYATRQHLLEIPAGTREDGESPEDCVHRELMEEIGHDAGRIEKLFAVYLAPGYSTELIHYYLATQLRACKGEADPDEWIDVLRIPLHDALNMIDAGAICDAKTVAGIALAARRLERQGLGAYSR